MIQYVAGFMFSPDFENVVLIEKQKPSWQKGKYNAVGGKIESGEFPKNAMVREFEEETAIQTNIGDWYSLCEIEGKDFRVYFFFCSSEKWDKHLSVTNEEVFHIPVNDLYTVRNFLLPNLNWLIHLAIDIHTGFSGKIMVS